MKGVLVSCSCCNIGFFACQVKVFLTFVYRLTVFMIFEYICLLTVGGSKYIHSMLNCTTLNFLVCEGASVKIRKYTYIRSTMIKYSANTSLYRWFICIKKLPAIKQSAFLPAIDDPSYHETLYIQITVRKTILFVFIALHVLAPSYIKNLLTSYSKSRCLRSADLGLLAVPWSKLKLRNDCSP